MQMFLQTYCRQWNVQVLADGKLILSGKWLAYSLSVNLHCRILKSKLLDNSLTMDNKAFMLMWTTCTFLLWKITWVYEGHFWHANLLNFHIGFVVSKTSWIMKFAFPPTSWIWASKARHSNRRLFSLLTFNRSVPKVILDSVRDPLRFHWVTW